MNVYKYHFGLGDRVSRPTPWPTSSLLRQLSLAQEENPRNGKESSQTLSPVPSLGRGRTGQRSWEVSLLQGLKSGGASALQPLQGGFLCRPIPSGLSLASPHTSALCWVLLPCPPPLTAPSLQASLLSRRPPSSPGPACALCPRPLPRLPFALPSHTPSPAPCSTFRLVDMGVRLCLPAFSGCSTSFSSPNTDLSNSPCFLLSLVLPCPPYLSHSLPSLFCCLLVFVLVSRCTTGLFLISPQSCNINLLSTYYVPGGMPVPPLTGLIARWEEKLSAKDIWNEC